MNPRDQMAQMLLTRLAPPALPTELQGLSQSTKSQISSTLANDEVSSDEEIISLWTQDCGIPEVVANKAIEFRSQFLMNPFFELFPDLHQEGGLDIG